MSIISQVKKLRINKIKEYFHITFTYTIKALDGTERYMDIVKCSHQGALVIYSTLQNQILRIHV